MVIDRSGNILGANLSARASFGEKITEKNIDKVFDSNNFINAVSRVLNKESSSENLIFYVGKPIDQKLYASFLHYVYILYFQYNLYTFSYQNFAIIFT